MTATLRKRRRAELQKLARDRLWARDDARALALEIARGTPATRFDAMGAGIVLLPGETAYRQVGTWLYVLDRGCWGAPSQVQVLLTDHRLLCQMPAGAMASLPWQGAVGLSVDLANEHVVLDYGDGRPLAFAGVGTPVVAVAVVAFIHGALALVEHPALAPLRRLKASDQNGRRTGRTTEDMSM